MTSSMQVRLALIARGVRGIVKVRQPRAGVFRAFLCRYYRGGNILEVAGTAVRVIDTRNGGERIVMACPIADLTPDPDAE